MAIAFDAASGPATVNPGTNVTQAHVTGSGSNRVLYVFVLSTLQDVSSVTYAGAACTQIGGYQVDFPSANRYLSVWMKLAPATGSNTISVTTSSSNLIRIEGASYSGVKQSLTVDNQSSGNDTSGATDPLSVSLTTVADNCWVVLFARAAVNNISGGSSGSVLRTTSNFNAILDSNGPKTPAGSQAMGATDGAGSSWGWQLVSMAPSELTISVNDAVTVSDRPYTIVSKKFEDMITLTTIAANITNATQTTYGDVGAIFDSSSPGRGSGAMFLYTAANHPNALIYFEGCFGSNGTDTFYLQLYTSGGSALSGSEVSTTSATVVRTRTSAVTMVDGTVYRVYAKVSGATADPQLRETRLIFDYNSCPPANLEVYIPLNTGGWATSTLTYGVPSTTYLPYTSLFYYDASNWSAHVVYFEATFMVGATSYNNGYDAAPPQYAAAYNASTDAKLTASEVSTTSTTLTRARSGPLNLAHGTSVTFSIRSGGTWFTGYFPRMAIVIVLQGNARKFESHHAIRTAQFTGNAGTSYASFSSILYYDPAVWSLESSRRLTFYEITMKASSGNTAYAQLYNNTDAAAITSSEVTTTSTTYVRQRSANIDANMPGAAKDMRTQMKTSAGTSDYASGGKVIFVVNVVNGNEYNVSVADDVTVTESTTLTGLPLVINVYDRVGVADFGTIYPIWGRFSQKIGLTSFYNYNDYVDDLSYNDLSTFLNRGDNIDNGGYLLRTASRRFGADTKLEAVFYTSGGLTTGNVYLGLHDTSDNAVSFGDVWLVDNTSSVAIVKSPLFKLTDATTYKVKGKADAVGASVILRAVNIQETIHVTSNSSLEFLIQLNAESWYSVSTSAAIIYSSNNNGHLFLYTAANWNAPSAYFESTLATTNASHTATATLYDLTAGAAVSSGSVTSTSTTMARSRTAAVTLVDGHEYTFTISIGNAASQIRFAHAYVVMQQGPAGRFEQHEVLSNFYSTGFTNTSYGSFDSSFGWEPEHWNTATKKVYFEIVLISVASNTVYAQVYNATGAAAITSSEVSTTSTSKTRLRSADISGNMPAAAAVLKTQVKNSIGGTTAAANLGKIITLAEINIQISVADYVSVTESVTARWTIDSWKDNFDSNVFNSRYEVSNATYVKNQNQRLEISTITTPSYPYLYTSNDFFDMTGKAVYIQLKDAGNQSLASFEVYPIELSPDVNNKVLWLVTTGFVFAYKMVAGVSSQVGSSAAYNAVTHKYLRIRESGGTTYWDYSSDLTNWTNLASQANPIPVTNLRIGVVVGNWNTEASGSTAIFDNLNTPTLEVSVSDAITVTESVTRTYVHLINVNDAITVTESVTVTVAAAGTNLSISVSDAITVTEGIVITLVNNIQVNDAVTVTESITVGRTSNISVYDYVGARDMRRNLVLNPSFEVDTSGWSLDADFTRITSDAYSGAGSVSQTSSSGYANFTTANDATGWDVLPNKNYKLTFYYKLTVNSGFAPNYEVNSGSAYGSNLVAGALSAQASWTRITISFNSGNNTKVWLRMYNNNGNVVGKYDAFQLELDEVTTYFDGSLSGSAWEGSAHNSVSRTSTDVVTTTIMNTYSISVSDAITVTESVSNFFNKLNVGYYHDLSLTEIRSFDAMKLSKDVLQDQPTDTFIADYCAFVASYRKSFTHIAIAPVWNTNAQFVAAGKTPSSRTIEAFIAKWATEIHGNNLKMLFRGTLGETEQQDNTNLTGTTSANATTSIVGVGTSFTTQLVVGNRISVDGGSTWSSVTAIADNTHLTVASAIGNGSSQTIVLKLGLYGQQWRVGAYILPAGTHTSAPTDGQSTYMGRTYDFIINNASIFADGDIWAPFPEASHDMFVEATSWLSYAGAGIQANYVTFFDELKQTSDLAFAAIGKKVITGYSSHNYSEGETGWYNSGVYSVPKAFVFDDYQQTVSEQQDDYDVAFAKGYHFGHQEWSDYWNGSTEMSVRVNFLRDMYRMMGTYSRSGKMFMFNYWGGWVGGVGEGVLINSGTSADPIWSFNVPGQVLAQMMDDGISEYVQVADVPNIALVNNVSKSDTVTVTESVSVAMVHNVVVSDAITVTDVPTVTNTQLGGISVNDAVTVTESINTTLVHTLSVNDKVWVYDGFRNAITFNGTSTVVDLGIPTVLQTLNNNFVIEVRVRPTALSGFQRIFAARRTNSANGIGFGFNGTGLRYTSFGVQDYDTTTVILANNTPYHIILKVDSSNNATFYVNGVNRQTVNATGGAANNNTDDSYQLGASTAALSGTLTELLNGDIAEIRIYKARQVTDQEATDRYNGIYTDESGLVLRYLYTEGTGNLTDTSGNGITGTVTSGTWGDAHLFMHYGKLTLVNNPSVSDAVTVTESVTTSGQLYISVNDAITVTDVPTVAVQAPVTSHSISVNDAVTVSESVALTLVNNVTVNDAVSVAETVTTSGSSSINVNDAVSVAENINVTLVHNISVFDAVTASDNTVITPGTKNGNIGTSISVNTLATTSKLVALVGNHQGTVTGVTLNGTPLTKMIGSATPFNETAEIWYIDNPGALTSATLAATFSGGSGRSIGYICLEGTKNGAPNITAANNGDSSGGSVNITPTVNNCIVIGAAYSEATLSIGSGETSIFIVQGSSFENAAGSYVIQTTAATQAVDFGMSFGTRWAIAAVAIETGVPAVRASITNNINVSDNVMVVDLVSQTDILTIAVGENITVTESVTTLVTTLVPSVSDTVTVTESVTMLTTLFISVSDSVSVVENLKVGITNNISVSDPVSVSESINMLETSFISVSDNVSLTEFIKFTLIDLISVNDILTVSESVAISLRLGDISVSDAVGVTESVQLLMTSRISVSDAVTVTESVQVNTTLNVSVNDAITLSESVAIKMHLGNISVSDSITVDDVITVRKNSGGLLYQKKPDIYSQRTDIYTKKPDIYSPKS